MFPLIRDALPWIPRRPSETIVDTRECGNLAPIPNEPGAVLSRLIRALILTALACALALPFPAPLCAQPADAVDPHFTFVNAARSLPLGRDPLFTVGFDVEDAEWISIGVRLFDRDGRALFYESAWIGPTETGRHTHDLDLRLDERDLGVGLYRLDAEISIRTAEGTVKATTSSPLALWDASHPPIDVAFITRIPTVIMSGPDGPFLTDPATETLARDALDRIASAVSERSAARATVAVAPVVLDEWRRISEGFDLQRGADVESVDREGAVPTAFDESLARARSAFTSDRLELAAVGFADPDLTTLAENGLADDIDRQLAAGQAIVDSIITTYTVTGMDAIRHDLPVEADGVMIERGLDWVRIDPTLATVEGEAAPGGIYPLAREPRISGIVADVEASDALAQGDVDSVLAIALDHQGAGDGPLIMSLDVTSTTTADNIAQAISRLSGTGGIRLVTAGELSPSTDVGHLDISAPPLDSPTGFTADVAAARERARALVAIALEPNQQEPLTARRTSLMAESYAWKGLDESWSAIERGRVWLDAARAATDPIIDALSLKVEPVTLSKDEGDIPIVIHNESDLTLTVDVVVHADEGIHIDPASVETTYSLRPNDNFGVIPVTLDPGASGDLVVQVMGGDLTLVEQSVAVRGSLLDRIAILGFIVLVLIGLLVFVRRRVRSAEARAEHGPVMENPASGSKLDSDADSTDGIRS